MKKVISIKKWRMLKWGPASQRARFSRRRFLWAFIGVAAVILLYTFAILPLVEAKKKAEEEILLKRRALLRYEEYLQNRKIFEEELDRTQKQYEIIQRRLLAGETPQLGAASLQEIVRRLSEKDGVGIRSFRMLEPKEIDAYRKISIQIDFNPNNSMLNLGQFIDDIETHEKKLMISEMELLVLNIRMPNQVQGSMVISGLMKGTKSKEKGRER
ncbi:MAG: type II secretion system protein GspM [Thermodesulfobacteriota bacterium]